MNPRSIEVERQRVPAGTDGAPVAAGLEALQSLPVGCLCRFLEVLCPASRRCGCVATRSVAIPSCGRQFGGASAASVRRLFTETQALIRRALYQDGSPVGGRRSATPRMNIAKRCCGSGRRGIRTRPAFSASGRASREGASILPRANVPVGGTNRAAASSPGGRCTVPSREGGTVRLARPGPYQGNPQPRVLGSRREPPGSLLWAMQRSSGRTWSPGLRGANGEPDARVGYPSQP
jgi:hypothetical protein